MCWLACFAKESVDRSSWNREDKVAFLHRSWLGKSEVTARLLFVRSTLCCNQIDRLSVADVLVTNDRSIDRSYVRAVHDGPTWNVADGLVVCERGAIVDSMCDDDWSNDSLWLCCVASKNDNVSERMQMSLYRTEVYRISIRSTVVVVVVGVVCQRRKLLTMCV